MQTGRNMNSWFLLLAAFVLSSAWLLGSEARVEPHASSEMSLDEKVRLLRGNDGSWRIPESVGNRASAADRQGLQNDPLTIYGVSGTPLGEIFQIRSADRYVGLLMVVNQKGRENGLSSGFSEVEWPLDRVSREFTLNDLDNALFEPKYYLMLDEDRLLLRVNLGKKELELNEVYLNAGDIRRVNSWDTERPLKR
ncbi:MAG: hypothetical protein ACWGQW_23915 [bacterium]